jgi:hypothetical protein
MTPTYTVRVSLNSVTYEVTADDEQQAIEKAHEFILEESTYDLAKWADYEVSIEECDVCEAPDGTPHCDCGQCDCGENTEGNES